MVKMNVNSMKKVYLRPAIEVQEIEVSSMLAASIVGRAESTESMNVQDWSAGESVRNSSESMTQSDWTETGW